MKSKFMSVALLFIVVADIKFCQGETFMLIQLIEKIELFALFPKVFHVISMTIVLEDVQCCSPQLFNVLQVKVNVG